MRTWSKRILALVLTLCLVAGMVPALSPYAKAANVQAKKLTENDLYYKFPGYLKNEAVEGKLDDIVISSARLVNETECSLYVMSSAALSTLINPVQWISAYLTDVTSFITRNKTKSYKEQQYYYIALEILKRMTTDDSAFEGAHDIIDKYKQFKKGFKFVKNTTRISSDVLDYFSHGKGFASAFLEQTSTAFKTSYSAVTAGLSAFTDATEAYLTVLEAYEINKRYIDVLYSSVDQKSALWKGVSILKERLDKNPAAFADV